MATLRLGGQTFTVRATVASLARARDAGVDLLGGPSAILKMTEDPVRSVTATYAIIAPSAITPEQWAEMFDSEESVVAAQRALIEALTDFSTAHGPLLRSLGKKLEQVHQTIAAQAQALADQIDAAPLSTFIPGGTSTDSPERPESIPAPSNSGNSESSPTA
jgi:hypothetical protein